MLISFILSIKDDKATLKKNKNTYPSSVSFLYIFWNDFVSQKLN